ncbi:thiosulfate:glutathione sulfurtransferase [Brachyhypopomus gauderio]|uniref:thiosulfate:glutathione sulfurtransferase n=1 Tax=Brachyhypopomus gauderio TaxID=698409 RepID=UPI0040435CB3
MANADMEISYSDLVSLRKTSEELLLVDVRSQEEVSKGRIPGSIHVPVGEVESVFSLDPDAFRERTGVARPPLDCPALIFHCQLGRRGEAATQTARRLGFKNARNYSGGYKEWSEKECK